MPWEIRGGRRYFYRKVRRGERVFSVYEGAGFAGQIAETRELTERAGREAERVKLRREAARQDRIDAKIGEACRIAEGAAREALEAAGYHEHKRQWRLRRGEAKTD